VNDRNEGLLELREELRWMAKERHLAGFIAFCASWGVPNAERAVIKLLEGEERSWVPRAKAQQLLLAARAYRVKVSQGDERELVFGEVHALLRELAPALSLDATMLRLTKLSKRFGLLPSVIGTKTLQRLRGGTFSKRGARGHVNYLFGLEQALRLRAALQFVRDSLSAPGRRDPAVFEELKLVLSQDFNVRPISRVAHRLAVKGVVVSEATLLGLRRGRYRRGDGYVLRERKAKALLDALKELPPLSVANAAD